MEEQELQINITAIDDASATIGAISATAGEMSGSFEEAASAIDEASSTVDDALSIIEEHAIDASLALQGAFDFGADMSTSVELAASNIVEALTGIDTAAEEAGAAAGASFSTGFSAATDPIMASMAKTMAEGDAPIIEESALIGDEAGNSMMGAMKDVMIAGLYVMAGSFLSGGIDAWVAAAQKPSEAITKIQDQIKTLKAAIDTQDASLQHSMGTSDQMTAKHEAVAAAVAKDNAQITLLTQSLIPLEGGNKSVTDAMSGTVNQLALWLQTQPQLTDHLNTFVQSMGVAMEITGGLLVIMELWRILAASTDLVILGLNVSVMAFLGWGLLIAAAFAGLVVIWDTWNPQIKAFFKTLDDNTGLTDAFKKDWQTISDNFEKNLLPALKQLWDALTPLEPIMKLIAEVIGGILIGAIILIADQITIAITGFTDLLTIVTKIDTFITNQFVKSLDSLETIISKITSNSDFKSIMGMVGSVGGAIGGAVSSVMPQFAEGGIVTSPTIGLIGEAGPEAIIPLSAFNGGNSLGGGNGGGAGGNIVINIGSLTGVSQAAAREFSTQLGKMINAQLKLKIMA